MKFDTLGDQAQMNNVLYHDNNALMNIKHSREQGEALETVAGQFEAMFLQMVLRQMRSSSDVLAEKDNPFSSQQYGVFRDMYDGQLAIEMAKKKQSGIADMLVKQLGPNVGMDTDSIAQSDAHFGGQDDKKQPPQQLAVNSPQEVVASVKELIHQGGTTSAFSQPLIRKMEL